MWQTISITATPPGGAVTFNRSGDEFDDCVWPIVALILQRHGGDTDRYVDGQERLVFAASNALGVVEVLEPDARHPFNIQGAKLKHVRPPGSRGIV
jgi:hypothetical protein